MKTRSIKTEKPLVKHETIIDIIYHPQKMRFRLIIQRLRQKMREIR